MADWQAGARAEGWTTFTRSVRIPLGARRHTVRVLELGDELEFYAEVPQPATGELVAMLLANRLSGLAYWHVDAGQVWAVSRCPRSAQAWEVTAYLRETAALADGFELQRSEKDS